MMSVYLEIDMGMPETCEQCKYHSFRGMRIQDDVHWLLDARCRLLPPNEDWYANDFPDNRGGWIGEDIDPENKMGYYYYHHCLREGTRAKQCPLKEK